MKHSIMIMVIAVLSLAGCGTVNKTLSDGISGLPSVQHCQRVSYLRDNGKITISADCLLPAADPGSLGISSIVGI